MTNVTQRHVLNVRKTTRKRNVSKMSSNVNIVALNIKPETNTVLLISSKQKISNIKSQNTIPYHETTDVYQGNTTLSAIVQKQQQTMTTQLQ